jgi:hypothetical protein
VTHVYNPSYSGGRRLGELGFEASPGKYFLRPYLKKKKKSPSQKRAGLVAQEARIPA